MDYSLLKYFDEAKVRQYAAFGFRTEQAFFDHLVKMESTRPATRPNFERFDPVVLHTDAAIKRTVTERSKFYGVPQLVTEGDNPIPTKWEYVLIERNRQAVPAGERVVTEDTYQILRAKQNAKAFPIQYLGRKNG